MTYFDSAEGVMITKSRAFKEVEKHGLECEWPLFLDDLGNKEEYDAQEVLAWLGY